jgi:hypothetical protein
MATRRRPEQAQRPRRPPATTPEGRENQLIELAVDLAERQLLDGTASSQVEVHFLKLGSSRERLEQERIRHENELLEVKKQQIERDAKMEDLFAAAIQAMRTYKGEDLDDGIDD